MLELTLDTRVDLARSGARHGLGLFETLRIQDGQPRWLEAHLARLGAGCAFLGLALPPPAEAVRAFLEAEGVLRGMGRGALRMLAVDDRLGIVAEAPPEPLPGPVILGRSFDTTRFSGNPLNRHKTLAYLENLRLTREAERRGLFEVVALNERGRLTDGGRTTLFLLRRGRLFTPPVAEGALPGIARHLLLTSGLAV